MVGPCTQPSFLSLAFLLSGAVQARLRGGGRGAVPDRVRPRTEVPRGEGLRGRPQGRRHPLQAGATVCIRISAESIPTLKNRESIHFDFLLRGFVEKESIHGSLINS